MEHENILINSLNHFNQIYVKDSFMYLFRQKSAALFHNKLLFKIAITDYGTRSFIQINDLVLINNISRIDRMIN